MCRATQQLFQNSQQFVSIDETEIENMDTMIDSEVRIFYIERDKSLCRDLENNFNHFSLILIYSINTLFTNAAEQPVHFISDHFTQIIFVDH